MKAPLFYTFFDGTKYPRMRKIVFGAMAAGIFINFIFSFIGITLLPFFVYKNEPDAPINSLYRLFFTSYVGLIIYIALSMAIWGYCVWAFTTFAYRASCKNTAEQDAAANP